MRLRSENLGTAGDRLAKAMEVQELAASHPRGGVICLKKRQ
jgi:hypothetical protein